jgi:Na+-transporting NADH:ubiquinone oxidoreductase subunit NqrC
VKIVEGEYNRTIRQALTDFAKKDYVAAKQNFQKAATIYPPAAEILSPLIKISQNKINSGESVASVTNNQAEVKQNSNSNPDFDSSQIVDFITENRMVLTVSLGSIIGLLVVVLIIALIAAAGQKKKQEQERLFRLQQLYQQRQMQMQAMGYSRNYPTSPNYPQNYNYPYTN